MRALDQALGAKRLLESDVDDLSAKVIVIDSELSVERPCCEILQRLTEESKGRLADLIIAGLSTVYSKDYKFRRDGKRLLISDNYVETDLWDGRGGGLSEFVALLVRLVALRQGKGGKMMTLIMDEPLKSLDVEKASKASRFLRMVAERMGVNVLITTHRPELAEQADVEYRFKKVAGATTIEYREEK